MNRVQELQFELMREASFNSFDGDYVVNSLFKNQALWRGAVFGRYEDLICLRDIPDGHWNVDTLWITPKPGKEEELERLAHTWNADSVGWINGEKAGQMLGSHSHDYREQQKVILRVWWD